MQKMMTFVVCAALAGAAGCKKEEKAEPTKPTAGKPDPAKPDPAKPDPAKPAAKMTGADMAKKMNDCFAGSHEAAKAAECYAADAKVVTVDTGMPAAEGPEKIAEFYGVMPKAFPDAKWDSKGVWVSGNWTAAVATMTGTNTGELAMMNMPPSGKKVVFHAMVLQEWNDEGKIKNEWHLADPGAMMAQVKPELKIPFRAELASIVAEPVIAANDEKEKANLAVAKAMNEAYGKGDLAGVTRDAADDMVMHDMPMPEDVTGKDKNAAMLKEGFGAFTENKTTPVAEFAAGDFVISVSTWEGKMTGDMASMKIKATNKPVKITQATITRWDGGKMKEIWAFYNAMSMMQQLGLMPPMDAPPADAKKKPGK